MLCLITTGIIMYWILPPGSGSHGDLLLGLSRHDWGDIHFWVAVGFVLVITYHLLLHLPWIKGTFFNFGNKRQKE